MNEARSVDMPEVVGVGGTGKETGSTHLLGPCRAVLDAELRGQHAEP